MTAGYDSVNHKHARLSEAPRAGVSGEAQEARVPAWKMRDIPPL